MAETFHSRHLFLDRAELCPWNSLTAALDDILASSSPSTSHGRQLVLLSQGCCPSHLYRGGSEEDRRLVGLFSHRTRVNICLKNAQLLTCGFIPAWAARLQAGNSAKQTIPKMSQWGKKIIIIIKTKHFNNSLHNLTQNIPPHPSWLPAGWEETSSHWKCSNKSLSALGGLVG